MKKYVFFLLLVNICFAVNAQNKSEKEPYLTKSFAGEGISKVIAETSGGNITVTGVDPSQSKVEVFVSQNNSRKNSLTDDELKSKVNGDYDLDISVKNNELTVTAKSKHKITDWKKALNFSFKIYAPKSASTDLTTSGGNISLSNLNNSAGKVNLEIPKNIGIDLKLSAMKISTGTLENFNGTNSNEEIKGTVNGGGIPVTVDAGSGKIDLVFN